MVKQMKLLFTLKQEEVTKSEFLCRSGADVNISNETEKLLFILQQEEVTIIVNF